MPSGENAKQQFPNGPYHSVAARDVKHKGKIITNVIGAYRCRCGARSYVQINKAGWPYVFCKNSECGERSRAQGAISAASMIAKITHWYAPARKDAVKIAAKTLPNLFTPIAGKTSSTEKVDHDQNNEGKDADDRTERRGFWSFFDWSDDEDDDDEE